MLEGAGEGMEVPRTAGVHQDINIGGFPGREVLGERDQAIR